MQTSEACGGLCEGEVCNQIKSVVNQRDLKGNGHWMNSQQHPPYTETKRSN